MTLSPPPACARLVPYHVSNTDAAEVAVVGAGAGEQRSWSSRRGAARENLVPEAGEVVEVVEGAVLQPWARF